MVKIKIEDRLPSGERICITLEGPEVSERRLLQVLEMLRLLGGASSAAQPPAPSEERRLKEIVWDAIEEAFGDGRWFSSRELHRVLREVYGVEVKLSTLSTYLMRFYESGLLERRGSRASRLYRVKVPSSASP